MLNLPAGLSLGAQQTRSLLETFKVSQQESFYVYPWKGLEERVKRMERSILPFVGYGSLLNSESAILTLDDKTMRSRKPIIAFGVQRIFNYEMEPDGGRYGPPTEDHALAALNICLTGKIDNTINAILVEISLKSISALRAREVGYDLVPIPCINWNGLDDPPFIAWILYCPDKLRAGKRRTNDTLDPHHEYYRVCRKGASEFGESFLYYWLLTTYLADGATTVAKWETTKLE